MKLDISIGDYKENFTNMMRDEWALITAGTKENGFNMMTASWGFIGEIWGKDTIALTVRPERYTMEFIDKNDYFTLSFYGDNKKVHSVCGSKSGRDTNKLEETGLTPFYKDGYVIFEEARLTFICKKLYTQKMDKDGFENKEDYEKWYGESGNMHNLIIGEIVKIVRNEHKD